jgi:hypothetical protein
VTFGNVPARGIFLATMKIGFSALAILAPWSRFARGCPVVGLGGIGCRASATADSRDAGANNALDLAPFGRWTLRDKAAQRRLA